MRTAGTGNKIQQTCTGPNLSYSRGRVTETKLDDFCKKKTRKDGGKLTHRKGEDGLEG
jgi:hypothetical protein